MARLEDEDIQEIISLYTDGYSPKYLGELFSIYGSSVLRILKRNNIDRNQAPIRVTNNQKEHICNSYISGVSSETLAKELNINPTTVCRILKKNNIFIRPGCENKRKYKINDGWLDVIDSQEKAYFLGLFWADGNISKSKNDIIIRLKTNDRDILVKLSKIFYNTDRVIDYVKKTNKSKTPVSKLAIYSKKLKARMLDIGLFPNKSKTIKFPSDKIISDVLINHFLRGLLDGDGCICIRKNGRITIDYTGNKDIINNIKSILGCRGIFSSVYYNKKKDSYSVQINRRDDILNFLNWIYKDSIIHLNRKYYLYKEVLNNYEK